MHPNLPALTRFALLATSLATLGGCATTADGAVETRIFEMSSSAATATYRPPGHCTHPGYTLAFQPGAGATLTLSDSIFATPVLWVAVSLAAGKTFAFASSTAQARSPEGAAPVAVTIPYFSYTPHPHGAVAARPADGLLSGPAPDAPSAPGAPTDTTTTFRTAVRIDLVRASEITLQLPDAVVDGTRVSFTPIVLREREIRFVPDKCLR